MGREQEITRDIKRHDPKLYCERNKEGTLCIFREGTTYDAYDVDGNALYVSRPTPHFVFALTDNWTTNGRPVPWGIEPIRARLKAIDLWSRELAEDLIGEYEKDEIAQERELDNSIEAFVKDFRSQVKKTFSDFNTSTLGKGDRRRNKNGNRKQIA